MYLLYDSTTLWTVISFILTAISVDLSCLRYAFEHACGGPRWWTTNLFYFLFFTKKKMAHLFSRKLMKGWFFEFESPRSSYCNFCKKNEFTTLYSIAGLNGYLSCFVFKAWKPSFFEYERIYNCSTHQCFYKTNESIVLVLTYQMSWMNFIVFLEITIQDAGSFG